MSFDFELFLSNIDPSQKYKVQTLTGGLVNLTVRASKVSASGGGSFPEHDTLILKYAPPFVATLGESAPFSQDRQLMEARALAQFTPPDGSLFSHPRLGSVSVPRLLYHSQEAHVLILEDLGPLLTLYQYLSAIGDETADAAEPGIEEACRKLGSRIGQFFGELNSPGVLELVQKTATDDIENSVGEDLILQVAVMTIREYLVQFHIPNAELLFSRVLADYQRVNLPAERCFTLGDFHPGAVFVAASGDGSQSLGIIDWEFSGLGRGPNGDMSQFLAILHLHLLASSPGSQRHRAIDSLIQGVCSAYHNCSSEWLEQVNLRMTNLPDAISSEPQTYSDGLQIFRSALILHGREMINNAVEQEWNESHRKETGALVQEMVQKGAWYLEKAGNDVEEMLDATNVEVLLTEDGRVLLSLFGIEH